MQRENFQGQKSDFFLHFLTQGIDWVTTLNAKLRLPPQSGTRKLFIFLKGRYKQGVHDDKKKTIMKNVLLKVAIVSGIVTLGGCSSVMSHTGGKEGLYPGTRASSKMLMDDDANLAVKSFVVLDMPFTAVADTLLLPWDMFRKDNSVKSRVEKAEEANLATNSVIPPAAMPAP